MKHRLLLGISLLTTVSTLTAQVPTGTWTTKASAPEARVGAAGAVINGNLYFVNGTGSQGCSPANYVYNAATDTWSTAAPPPYCTDVSGAAAINGILYIVGGCINAGCADTTKDVIAYDPSSNTWAFKTPMPTARSQFGVGVINGMLYVAGGTTKNGTELNTLEVYDPSSNSWSTKTPMPIAAGGPSAQVINGQLYVVGGGPTPGVPGGQMQAYDPATDSWSQKTPMPTPRGLLATGVIDQFLFAAGGATVTGATAVNEAYDPTLDLWSESTPMPTAQDLAVSGVVNGSLYIVGGYDANMVPTAANQAFTPIGPPATLTLAPKTATNTVGETHCVTATVKDVSGNPVANITVDFSVPTAVATHASPSSASATTDTNGQATFCYSASLPGVDTIHAFADTNNNGTQDAGEPFDDATETWILPTSTQFCEVTITDGGWIIANDTDKANFGGNAKVQADGTVQGNQQYTDQGPVQPFAMKSIQLTATTCNDARTTATIFGTATINGAGAHVFRIDVMDNMPNTYGITLDTGYISGQHALGGGQITIH